MIAGSSRVTRKGQITIPADVRRKLDINVGDTVLFDEQDGQLTVLRPEDVVDSTAGMFKNYAKNEPDPDRADIWVGIARERGTID